MDAEFKRVWIEDGRTLMAEGEIGGRYGLWPIAWLGMDVRGAGRTSKKVGTRDLEEMLEKLEKVVVK